MAAEHRTVVATASGRVLGSLASGVASFRGIPYAASPVGELRFAPPRRHPGWVGVRDAERPGPAVPQGPSRLEAVMGHRVPDWGERDCLNLNVWAPSEAIAAGPRPVLLWFHGGGLASGSSGWDWYDGAKLVVLGGIVVVTANYRHGPLGYLHLPAIGADNLGLQDQTAALRWVRDNIAVFGGDPDSITVGGQSAGAYSALALAVAPETRDLVCRVIAQSGPWGMPPQERADAAETAAAYLHILGIDDAASAGKELRGLPVGRLLAAYWQLPTLRSPRPGAVSPPMCPVVGGAGMPRSWRQAVNDGGLTGTQVLLGTTADEAAAFFAFTPAIEGLIRDQVLGVLTSIVGVDAMQAFDTFAARRPGATPARIFTDFVSEQLFGSGVTEIATAAAEAYVYRFSRRPAHDGTLGAPHCADLPFLFNTFDAYSDAPMLGAVDDHDRDLSRAFGGALAAFAATGSPNGPGLGPWAAWHPGPSPEVMRFG